MPESWPENSIFRSRPHSSLRANGTISSCSTCYRIGLMKFHEEHAFDKIIAFPVCVCVCVSFNPCLHPTFAFLITRPIRIHPSVCFGRNLVTQSNVMFRKTTTNFDNSKYHPRLSMRWKLALRMCVDFVKRD